jgi:hypothetical protein
LQQLFEAGYTIVALPFRFSFRHWSIALTLLTEQDTLRQELPQVAKQLGYAAELYQDKSSYRWIGHSLGCKYITLLELLSDDRTLFDAKIRCQIEQAFAAVQPTSRSILNQPSVLLAPDISDTESAIPVRAIAQLIDRLGFGVKPTRKQTQCLIEQSQLFNLMALISFDRDDIAGNLSDLAKPSAEQEKSDVLWFINTLTPKHLIYQEIFGKHLEPIGVRIGELIVDFNPLDKFIKRLSERQLEPLIQQFLAKLQSLKAQV